MSPPTQPRTLKEILKDLRRVLAPPGEPVLTQKRLARALGVTPKYFSRMESGSKRFLLHHARDLALLRPKDEERAREFDALMDELRAVLLPPSVGERTRLESIGSQVEGLHTKLDKAEAQREANKSEIIRAIWSSSGFGGLTALLAVVLVCGQLSDGRRRSTGSCPATASAPAAAPKVVIVTNMAQTGGPLVFDLQAFLGAIATGEMGKKEPEEFLLPSGILPGQKLPPCDASLSEQEINGGCWTEIARHPPCGRLF